MIPSANDLKAIGKKRTGTLAEVPFPALLRSFVDGKRTLVLRLARGPLEKLIVFESGMLVDCESNLLHESLGRVLVAQGKLKEAEYQKALAWAASHDKSLSETLVSSKIIASYDLFKVMQASLAHKLLDVFAWTDGTFQVLGDSAEVESPLRVNVAQLIVTGVLRSSPQAHVDVAITPLVGRPLAVHPSPAVPLSALRLATRYSRALNVLKRPQRLDELMASSGLNPNEITRLVYALAILGVILPADQVPREAVAGREASTTTAASPPSVAHEPPRPAHSASSSGEGAAAVDGKDAARDTAKDAAKDADRDAVMSLYMRHRRGDAFDLLGVTPSSSIVEIAAAYRALAETCAPWRYRDAAIVEKAEELFFGLARAFTETTDGDLRERLLARRTQGAAAPPRPRADVYAIKTSLLDADGQYRSGLAHKEAGRYAQALPLLDFAADLDAANARYRAEAAHCRFLDSPNTQARAALAQLAEAARLDPGCGVAWLYTGQIHIAVGDFARGRAALADGLRHLPHDEQLKAALRAAPG